MSAYLITDVEITDPALYGQFLEQMTPTIDSYGGRFIVRGGGIEVIGGDWAPKRIAILEFDSTERAKSWLGSPEFNRARRDSHQVLQHKHDTCRGPITPLHRRCELWSR